MSYPPGIILRPVTIGGATTIESGEHLSLVAEIKSSRGLMWGATGWQFHAVPRTIKGADGEELTFSLPVTDLAGWRLLDNPGSAIDVSTPGSYTHSYTVKLTTVQGGRHVAVRTVGPFVLPTEDLSPVDLDLALPVGTQAGGVVLVPDTWDAKVSAAEAVTAAITPAGLVLTSATDAEAQRAALAVVERSAALAPSLPRQRHPRPTVWTAFQPGHGWTTAGAAGAIVWNLNDPSSPLAGSQCVSFVTQAIGTQAWIQAPVGGAGRDLTNVDLTIWLRINSGLEHLTRVQIALTGDNYTTYFQGNSVYDGTWPGAPVRVLREGEWFPLRFNFAGLTSFIAGTPSKANISSIRITLQDKGTGQVSGQLGRLEYAPRPPSFPNGIMSFAFDDGYADTVTRAAPILARQGMAATLYAIADRVGTGSGFATLGQLHELEDKYSWEVAAHAYAITNHDAGFPALAPDVLDQDLSSLKAWLTGNGFRGYDHLAYPRGHHNADTDSIVKRYFSTGRTIYDRPVENYRPALPLRLRSLQGGAAQSIASIQTRIDEAKAHGGWFILTLHQVLTSGATGNQVNADWLTAVSDYAASAGIEVMPVGDVWRSLL